jgi:hypothetical protein
MQLCASVMAVRLNEIIKKLEEEVSNALQNLNYVRRYISN